MSKQVEPILAIKEKTIILPRAGPTIVEGILVPVRIRYNEPRFNQQSGSIVRGVPRYWSRGIHCVNRIPRPNPP